MKTSGEGATLPVGGVRKCHTALWWRPHVMTPVSTRLFSFNLIWGQSVKNLSQKDEQYYAAHLVILHKLL